MFSHLLCCSICWFPVSARRRALSLSKKSNSWRILASFVALSSFMCAGTLSWYPDALIIFCNLSFCLKNETRKPSLLVIYVSNIFFVVLKIREGRGGLPFKFCNLVSELFLLSFCVNGSVHFEIDLEVLVHSLNCRSSWGCCVFSL